MKNQVPLISCICITKNKPDLLRRAINCFEEQTYSSKELILVYENNDLLTKKFIQGNIFSARVKIIEVKSSHKKTLGQLRNFALQMASGEYACQWDDDDWYHNNRIEYQYNFLIETGFKGCILNQWIVYDYRSKKAYLSNRRLWEGSILCKRDILMLKEYEDNNLGEDTPVITYLCEKKYLNIIEDSPNLYIYVYHGSNSWNSTHWQFIFDSSQELSESTSLIITKILYGEIPNNKAAYLLDFFQKYWLVGLK